MSERSGARGLLAAPLLVSGLLVSGCMSSPTYGTGVSANTQLATDVSTMFSLKPKKTSAEYAPRPELVKPAGRITELPAPQESVVTASADQWPESPEQRRARIRAEAGENADKAGWESDVVNDISVTKPKSAPGGSARSQDSGVASLGKQEDFSKKAAEVKAANAAAKQGSPTVRRTLTEPPLDYRQPAQTAAADDLGEDELKKKRRLKAEAKKAAGDSSWKDLVPWL